MNIDFNGHSLLIKKVYEILSNHKNDFKEYPLTDSDECRRVGYGKDIKKNLFVVTAEDCALELGSPKHKSVSQVLWTKEYGFTKGKLWVSGKDFDEIKAGSVSFLQLILLCIDETCDPTDSKMVMLKNLNNKIPGLMARTFTDKLWIRIHKKLMRKNFSLYSLGSCLYKHYTGSMDGILGMDILLITCNDSLISKFEPISSASKIISQKNKKLRWEKDGLVCDDLTCDSCEEKPSCDTIREIVAIRRTR